MTALLRLENLALGLSGAAWVLHSRRQLDFVLRHSDSGAGCLISWIFGKPENRRDFYYNLMHSWIAPVVTLSVGWVLQLPLLISIGLIWAAHIGFDRAMGYGLKHYSGFKDTHLGRIGGSVKS